MHSDDAQPGLIVLRICSSSQLFVAHRKSEASTVHLCAVCLFLWFKVENLEIILSSSWTFLGSTVLGPMGVQLFHRQSLYFRKKTSSGEPCISATTCLGVGGGGGGGLGFSWFNPRCSVAGCGSLTCHGLGTYLCVPIVPIRYEYLSNRDEYCPGFIS